MCTGLAWGGAWDRAAAAALQACARVRAGICTPRLCFWQLWGWALPSEPAPFTTILSRWAGLRAVPGPPLQPPAQEAEKVALLLPEWLLGSIISLARCHPDVAPQERSPHTAQLPGSLARPLWGFQRGRPNMTRAAHSVAYLWWGTEKCDSED